ncbi:YceD family protein [Candidatus Nitrosoglobus terrae]|nr:YceD family protein [Candidatus Nitrosoglobus terrae]
MLSRLPDCVFPWQLARSRRSIEGYVPFSQMPRLAYELLDQKGYAQAKLKFDYDGKDRYFIQGKIEACLNLTCQRCLHGLMTTIDSIIQVGLMVSLSEIPLWPDEYEPWIVKPAETASLWSLVEEELLLSIPIVARHPVGECTKGEIYQLVELYRKEIR